MGRTALEFVGQAGLGYSFDPLVNDKADEFASSLKSFRCASALHSAYQTYLTPATAVPWRRPRSPGASYRISLEFKGRLRAWAAGS